MLCRILNIKDVTAVHGEKPNMPFLLLWGLLLEEMRSHESTLGSDPPPYDWNSLQEIVLWYKGKAKPIRTENTANAKRSQVIYSIWVVHLFWLEYQFTSVAKAGLLLTRAKRKHSFCFRLKTCRNSLGNTTTVNKHSPKQEQRWNCSSSCH